MFGADETCVLTCFGYTNCDPRNGSGVRSTLANSAVEASDMLHESSRLGSCRSTQVDGARCAAGNS